MTDVPDAPDTKASAQITDHPFDPVGEWWSVCKHCRLYRAAHATAVPGSEKPEERPEPLPVSEIDKSVMEEHTATCGAPGPAPLLSCDLRPGHGGLHSGVPAAALLRDPDDPAAARIHWGNAPVAEQDDPIGGGRIQEYLRDPATQESWQNMMPDHHEEAAYHHLPSDTAGKRVVDSRQELYGDAVPNIERVARGWSIIAETQITPQMVPLMMVWLKIVRESQSHLQDNLDDIEGYVEIMRRVVKELGP